jgi:hypothetical protein
LNIPVSRPRRPGVRGLPLEPAPAELSARLDAALAGKPKGGGSVIRGWWAPATAAAAVLVAFLVWPRGTSEPRLPTEARQPEKPAKAAEEFGTAGLKAVEEEDGEVPARLDGDAPADREARDALGSPQGRGGKKGARKERRRPEVEAKKAKAVPAPERLIVETVAGEPLRGERMAAYLGELAKFERAKLQEHIESFGILARPAPRPDMRAEAADGKAPVVRLSLASDDEAQRVAALLRRAYPAAARRGKAEASGGAGSAYTAKISGAKGGMVALEIEATKPQLDRIHTWLDRISPRWRAQHANKMMRVNAVGLPAAAVKPQRWRIELAFPAKPKRD